MRQTAFTTWLATSLAIGLTLGPLQAQKKDAKAAPPVDPKQQAITSLVVSTDEAMKGAAGTAVFTVDPAAATFETLMDHGLAAGTQKKGSIDGLFDLRALNALLEKSGAETVSAAGLGADR